MASSKSTKEDRVVVRHVGSMIAQSAIIEIKTRAAHKELDMEAIHSRDEMSQTTNLVAAYCIKGRLHDIRIIDLHDLLDD